MKSSMLPLNKAKQQEQMQAYQMRWLEWEKRTRLKRTIQSILEYGLARQTLSV